MAAGAGEDPPRAANPSPEPTATLTNSPVLLVEPGIYEVGTVRLDQRQRSITFPATLNRSDVPMEYFLVTTYGKTHESILKTEAAPFDIHLAMLLLGARESGDANFPGTPTNGVPGLIANPSSETIPGDKAAITVKWKTARGETEHAAEDLVWRSDRRSALEHGAWVYNGSLIIRGKFLAQESGSIVSLVTDPVALVNNIAPGHDNDDIWTANTNNLPPAGEPVEVTISLGQIKSK
jgi:hypothetical protein